MKFGLFVVVCSGGGGYYIHFSMKFCLILVVTTFRWSFSGCELRTAHWSYESSCFVHTILSYVVEESDLPAVLDVRACLFIDLNGLVVSDAKLNSLREEFAAHLDCFERPDVFEGDVILVKDFMLMVVEEFLSVRGVKEEVTFHLSVCCPALLLSCDPDVLSAEVAQFTELLMELRRVTAVEKRRMDRSFPVFLDNYRRIATGVTSDSASSAVEILRACDGVSAQRLFRFLMCLNESPLLPLRTPCGSVGHLRSDITTSVCSSVLSFLKAHRIRRYESVSGPFLEEIAESFGRFTTLSDVTDDMLWDDVGVVAAEDYRQSLYELLGFTEEGERAPSPEI